MCLNVVSSIDESIALLPSYGNLLTTLRRVIITLVMLQLGGFVIPKSQIWPWWCVSQWNLVCHRLLGLQLAHH
jgi:hypothetical protein